MKLLLTNCIILNLIFNPFFPFFFYLQIKCSGLFELRLKSFANDMGRNSLGSCCTEKQSANGTCIGSCQTRFQICLKNYQAEIDTTSPCTFGAVVTPVLGDNTFNLTPSFYKSQQSDESINPIRFPFDFTWPVSINIFALVENSPYILFITS